MSIVVPAEFDYSPRMDVRLQEAITGDSGGEVRVMLDNATYNYATSGRRTLISLAPASSTPASTLGAFTTSRAVTDGYEPIGKVYVELSADTTTIVWTAWVDDAQIWVKVTDEVAETTLLDENDPSTASAGVELTGTLDVSARAGDKVLVIVRYRGGDATPANSALYSITIFEDDLTAGELPT